jgi:hypothetical protein
MLAGTGTADINQASSDPKMVERIERNTAEFAPEMGRYVDAQIMIMAAMIKTIMTHVAAHPEELEKENVRSGLAKIRAGTKQTLIGAVTTLLNGGLDDAWRRGRVAALAYIAPTAAKLLLPEDGRAVRETTLDVAQSLRDPEVQRGLKAFADAFAPG